MGDKVEQQKLRRAFNAHDRKKIGDGELAHVIDEAAAEIIEELVKTGSNIVTDGQIRAYDPISHIAAKINGFEIGGLLRFFDTNFYYRQPKVISPLSCTKPLVADEFTFARQIGKNKASAVAFGPYSLLKMSDNTGDELMSDLTDIYATEICRLRDAGARLVQFDEPAILINPDDAPLFQSIYDRLKQNIHQIEILIALYFGNAVPMIENLAQLRVDGIVFDFTYSPGLDAALAGFPGDIGLGIVDARNTKMETQGEIAARAESILKSSNSSKIYITTSCGLEYLPRNRAFEKQKLCADAACQLRGEKS